MYLWRNLREDRGSRLGLTDGKNRIIGAENCDFISEFGSKTVDIGPPSESHAEYTYKIPHMYIWRGLAEAHGI